MHASFRFSQDRKDTQGGFFNLRNQAALLHHASNGAKAALSQRLGDLDLKLGRADATQQTFRLAQAIAREWQFGEFRAQRIKRHAQV